MIQDLPVLESPTAYSLPSLPYVRLRMTLRAEETASPPPFQGSMLRGAFGHALRRLACTMGAAQTCESCPLRHACPYPRIFQPLIEGPPPPFLRGIREAVRPYVFEPLGGAGRLAPGDDLRFDLLLFGQAVDLQAYATVAIERMARGGLGTGRARFRLIQAEPADSGVLRTDPLPSGPLALRLLTPLRVKSRDHLNDRPTFRDLAFNMLRRVLEMAHFHVPGANIDWSFRGLLESADAVRIVDSDLRWHDWERWSQRQQSSMKLGGLVGKLVLEGDLHPFTTLLRAAEIVHVGKGATFGLGKIAVEPA
jgi:CRISPR-associated endoribonuclease Cas6